MCCEVNARHDILLTDLGAEKLREWIPDGRDGFGATITGQLLLTALRRGHELGYSTGDLVRFLTSIDPTARAGAT